MCAHGRCCIHESVARPQFCTRGAADQVRAAARFVHVNRLAARRHRSAKNPDGGCVGLQWQFSDRKIPRFQVRRARLAEPHRCLLQPSSRLVRPSPMPRPSEHAAIASTRVSYLPPDPVRRSLCSRLAEVAGRPMASKHSRRAARVLAAPAGAFGVRQVPASVRCAGARALARAPDRSVRPVRPAFSRGRAQRLDKRVASGADVGGCAVCVRGGAVLCSSDVRRIAARHGRVRPHARQLAGSDRLAGSYGPCVSCMCSPLSLPCLCRAMSAC